MLTPSSNVAILGFGSRAAAFAELLAPRGCALRAWDPALGGPDGDTMRVRIESTGVDCMAGLAAALRGARLVVLDTMPMTTALAASLAPGQQSLDLATATATQVDAVLAALGLPPTAPRWQSVVTALASTMANSAAATPGTPRVRRGELP